MAHQGIVMSQQQSVALFGEGYDRWDYKPAIKKIQDILVDLFKIKSEYKDMKFQKEYSGAKDIYAIQNNYRFLILNWESFEKVYPKAQKVEVNPKLEETPWGGKMIIVPDEDPLK